MDGLEHTADQIHKMATGMADTHKSAASIGDVFTKWIALSKGADMLWKGLKAYVQQTETAITLERAFSKEGLDRSALTVNRAMLVDKLDAESARHRRLRNADKKAASKLLVEEHQAALNANNAQLRFAKEWHSLNKAYLVAAGAAAGLVADLLIKSKEFNQNLIEANSSFHTRNNLLYSTLLTQIQLGASFGKVTEAAQAMVSYGLDTESSFDANLKLVMQLNQGVGVSVQTAANLATIVERNVKGSFEEVSHVVSQLVNDTALAGEEAAKLAASVGLVASRLGPGVSLAGLPEVVKLVSKYESALKEVGGVPGTVEQMLASLTTPEGFAGAGMVGVDPEFIATAKGVQQVMDGFMASAKTLVPLRGSGRQMGLENLGHMFNVSAVQANQLMLAIERAKNQTVGDITAQQRWVEQMRATDAGWTRLTNSVTGLLQYALYPAVVAVGWLGNTLASVVEWVLKSKTAIWAFSVGVWIGAAVVAKGLWSVSRALVAVALSAAAATKASQRLAVAQAVRLATTWGGKAGATAAAGAAGGGLWGLIRSTFTSGFSGLLRPLMLISRTALISTGFGAIAAATLGSVAWYAMKQWGAIKQLREASDKSHQLNLLQHQKLDMTREANVYRAARFGTSADVKRESLEWLSDAASTVQDITDPAERLKQMAEWEAKTKTIIGEQIAQGIVTKVMGGNLTQSDTKGIDDAKESLSIWKDLAVHSKGLHDIAKKNLEKADEGRKEAELQDAKVWIGSMMYQWAKTLHFKERPANYNGSWSGY